MLKPFVLSLGLFMGVSAMAADNTAYFNQQGNQFDLNFNPQHYKSFSVEVNGKPVKFRAFENIVYVKNALEPDYQAMHLYIPEAYFNGAEVNGFNAQNAPIFLPNAVGGYMPAKPATFDSKGFGRDNGKPNAIVTALSKGYVVASLGARGRTLEKDGVYTGKAPAAIVDLKAAVRYLHFNDARMPGDANKIISNGTSAGGALSALLGASGDNADYQAYLAELGAAKASDAIFAVSAYCPITNLEHADSAYEWEFNGVNQYQRMDMSRLNARSYNDRSGKMPMLEGTLNAEEIAVSDALKKNFPTYLNSLNLKDAQGKSLTLDAVGDGSFKDYLASVVARGAQKALQQQDKKLGDISWLKWQNQQISGIDWQGYVHSAKRMKSPPAFDTLDLSSGENNLFGTAKINNQHFTPFSQQHSTAKGATMADGEIIKLMNPLNYLAQSPTAHWRIRVGSADRDSSHAISAILALRLANLGKSVDYEIPWGVPHAGDYDLDELFQWTDSISK